MRARIKKIVRFFGVRRPSMIARCIRAGAAGVINGIGRCIFLLARSRPVSAGTAIESIVIIRIDCIGDLVLSTPAIRALRKAYPRAAIDILVREYTQDIVAANPCIRKVLCYRKDTIARCYDMAVVLHPGFVPAYLAWKSNAAIRIGYESAGSFFLTKAVKDDRATRLRHEVESALEVAKAAGCTATDTRVELYTTGRGEQTAAAFLSAHGFDSGGVFVVMHPGARQRYIRWHAEGFARVAEMLVKRRGIPVVLTGSKAERVLLENIQNTAGVPLALAYDIPLAGLSSLIKRAALFIGNSTGPLHIAAGWGVPTVALFGPQHPLDSPCEWGPWQTRSIVLHKNIGCRHCHPSDCMAYNCLGAITAEEVYGAAVQLLDVYDR